MSARLVFTVRCPLCGMLPTSVIGPTQAICGTEGCPGLIFNPTRPVAEQLGDIHEVRLAAELGAPAGLELPAPPRPPAAGTDAERVAEAQIRASFHVRGYRCADGLCPVCGPTG